MTEDPRNIGWVCDLHAPHPDPRFAACPAESFVGHFVKLGFDTPQGSKEHMWVWVLSVADPADPSLAGQELVGRLDNDPVLCTAFQCGDLLAFRRDEIEAISEG